MIRYHETDFEEREISTLKDFYLEKDEKTIIWITIDGLQDVKLFDEIGEKFALHPLVLKREWRWGYFGVLGVMLAVALLMVRYFKKTNDVKNALILLH